MKSAEYIDIKVLKIYRLASEGRIKAFADIGINDALLIKGIRVVQGKKCLFVSMPVEQGKNERWYERVRCLSQDIRELIAQEDISSIPGCKQEHIRRS